jgi:transcriptional regulator with XRE-family HTH domain
MSQIVDDPRRDDDGSALAERLRGERTGRGWSLTELAEASGVSRAMINRIERGVSSPTATILGRLSGAFGLTVSELLDEHAGRTGGSDAPGAPGRPAVPARPADRWRDPDTGYERRAVSSRSFPADVTEVRLPAGQEVTYPASAYAFLRHLIWVLDGTLELVLGGEPTTLAAGERIELGDPVEVTYRNPADEPCRYVVVVVRR